MKIKHFAILCIALVISLSAKAQRDTIFIYDTIRITVTRPAPPQVFFETPATFSENCINIDEQLKQSSTMNNFRQSANRLIQRIALGTTLLATSVSTVFADTPAEQQLAPTSVQTQPQTDTIVRIDSIFDVEQKQRFPIYLSFAYPLGLFLMESENYIFNLAISALTGAVGGIEGLQVGGIFNQVSGSMRGLQVGGIINITERVDGLQVGGISNFSRNVNGLQVGGIYNQSGEVQGAQIGGIANVSDGNEGVQIAGIYNHSGDVRGAQISGISNVAENVDGAQIGAIFNHSRRTRGVQIGLVNSTEALSGVQIGLVNRADTTHRGVSIGLINVGRYDRFREIEVNHTLHGSTLLGYRTGRPVFHTMFAVGTNWERGHFESRVGFGNLTRLFHSFYLQTSLYWNNSTSRLQRNDFETRRFQHDSWTTLSAGLVFYWGDRLGIKIAPNLQYWTNFNRPLSQTWTISYAFGLDFGLSVRL